MAISIEEQAITLKEVEERSKGNARRIDSLEKKVDDLADVVGVLQAMKKDLEYLNTTVSETKSDVKSLMEKPAKRWDTLVEKILWGVVGAVLTFILAKGGL